MDMILRLTTEEPAETVDTNSVKISENEVVDLTLLKESISFNCGDVNISNEFLSEILNTGKYFNFPYLLDKEKYKEFIAKYTPCDYYGNDIESEILNAVTSKKQYITISVNIVQTPDSLTNDISARIEAFVYNEFDPNNFDYFFTPLNTEDDYAKLIEILNEVTCFLGKPDNEEKKRCLNYYTNELVKINNIVEHLNKIK